MSKGKYSPALTRKDIDRPYSEYCYNADKQIPPEYVKDRDTYETRLHMDNYDENGYDSYGYSAFDKDGNYVGISSYGVDRYGYSEMDYLSMSDEDFEDICRYGI